MDGSSQLLQTAPDIPLPHRQPSDRPDSFGPGLASLAGYRSTTDEASKP